MGDLAPAIVMIVTVVTLGSVFGGWLRGKREARLLELRTQLHNRALDRFENAADVREYLASQPLGVPELEGGGRGTAQRLLASVQIGIVAAAAGTGLLAMRRSFPDVPELDEGMLFLGGLALAVGLGFVASALIGRYLAGRWNLLESPTGASRARSESPGDPA